MMWQLIDRKTATERGMMYLFTGKPCRNFGNVWLRNTNRGKCFCPDCKKQRREKGYEAITPFHLRVVALIHGIISNHCQGLSISSRKIELYSHSRMSGF